MSFQAYLDNIKAKTGKTPDDFKKLAAKKGLLEPNTKAGDIVAWLKEDFELGHGHAMAIYASFKDMKSPEHQATVSDKHFAGGKSAWQPVYEGLLDKLKTAGLDITIAPTSTYLSLLKGKKKFAIVQVSAERMDIGIKLKDAPVTERFEAAGKWNSMVTHRVRITEPKQVNKELLKWLQDAYINA